jgi:hypothetical protein
MIVQVVVINNKNPQGEVGNHLENVMLEFAKMVGFLVKNVILLGTEEISEIVKTVTELVQNNFLLYIIRQSRGF